MLKRFLPVLFLAVLTGACTTGTRNITAWPYGVNYEVFVLSFADANGDGKGDIPGLTSKLDYLKDLGVGGLWLMPIMPSPSYHKYDVTDYKGIHPDYGTVADFKKFVEEAHKRNIRVIIDLILNHSGDDHPWFVEALKGKGNPYHDYYVWAKKDSIRQQLAKKAITLDSDNITQWHVANGDSLADHYYGFFNRDMPDLNFDNPRVRQEFVDIGKFWLGDMKVDGFRLDAARHIYPDERKQDSHAFWSWFRKEMQQIKPDVYLVGEVWAQAAEVAPYLKGLPALFNFDMGYAIAGVVHARQDTIGLVAQYKKISDYYAASTSDYVDATFIRNHDQNRILTELGDKEEEARMAASILFTLPGTPYVYYGEEIGMKGRKPDELIREPFLWDVGTKDTMQTRWEAPVYSTDRTVQPLAVQQQDPRSLWRFYKKWIAFRNASEALTFGTIRETDYHLTDVISFIREYKDDKVIVLHNISDVEVTVQLGSLDQLYHLDFYTKPGTELLDSEIVLPAFSSAILKN